MGEDSTQQSLEQLASSENDEVSRIVGFSEKISNPWKNYEPDKKKPYLLLPSLFEETFKFMTEKESFGSGKRRAFGKFGLVNYLDFLLVEESINLLITKIEEIQERAKEIEEKKMIINTKTYHSFFGKKFQPSNMNAEKYVLSRKETIQQTYESGFFQRFKKELTNLCQISYITYQEGKIADAINPNEIIKISSDAISVLGQKKFRGLKYCLDYFRIEEKYSKHWQQRYQNTHNLVEMMQDTYGGKEELKETFNAFQQEISDGAYVSAWLKGVITLVAPQTHIPDFLGTVLEYIDDNKKRVKLDERSVTQVRQAIIKEAGKRDLNETDIKEYAGAAYLAKYYSHK